jgi:RNA polymerase sigma factor (sigma-70 family)
MAPPDIVPQRRSPGALPPPLTPAQQRDAARCYPIIQRLARFYGRRRPAGLNESDLHSVAGEALLVAVSTHDASKGPLEPWVWLRVRGILKNAIQQTAKQAAREVAVDAQRVGDGVAFASSAARSGGSRMSAAAAASRALDDFALVVRDTGDVFNDTDETLRKQFTSVCDDAATALAIGAAGHLWHTRGEDGLVLQAEYVRTIKRLHDEVADLPAQLAMVLELRYFREQQIEEVASAMGVSPQKVTRLVGEAVRLLRARLQARGVSDASVVGGP